VVGQIAYRPPLQRSKRQKVGPLFTKRLRDCRTRDHNGQADTDGGWIVLVPDYIAIGVLIVCIVWVVADWIPRGKL
jgi:hypothetical protein